LLHQQRFTMQAGTHLDRWDGRSFSGEIMTRRSRSGCGLPSAILGGRGRPSGG